MREELAMLVTMGAISIVVTLGLVALELLIFYKIMKAAVRNGILEAKQREQQPRQLKK